MQRWPSSPSEGTCRDLALHQHHLQEKTARSSLFVCPAFVQHHVRGGRREASEGGGGGGTVSKVGWRSQVV